jgi:hypothetical protein
MKWSIKVGLASSVLAVLIALVSPLMAQDATPVAPEGTQLPRSKRQRQPPMPMH